MIEGAHTPIAHASDVAIMRTCLRKWHGVMIQGYREADSPATARGTAIHAILEGYLDTGIPIDTTTLYGQIAASGLHLLPAPRSGITEHHFSLAGQIIDGVPAFVYCGAIDWIHATERSIKDHKTTSSWKYIKDEATLRLDPQVIVYGSYAAATRIGSDTEFEWIYYLTAEKSARKSRSVRFAMSETELTAAKAALDAEVMRSIGYRSLPMLSLPPTPSACFRYGRPCHLKHLCTDVKPKIGDMMSQTKDQLLAELKAKMGAIGAPPGVPVPSPVAAVAPPTLAVLPTAALPSVPSIPTIPAIPAITSLEKAAIGVLNALPGVSLPALPVTTIGGPGGFGSPPAIDPAIMAAAEAKPKGRPKVEPTVIAPPPAAVAPPTPGAVGQGPLSGRSIGTLYVNCIPMGGTYTDFADVARECHKGIRDTIGLAHYRLADFGKGAGIWAEAVRIQITANPVQALYVDTSANDGRDALEILLQLSAAVIRGVR